MDATRATWRNTTHDWTKDVDADHLSYIRSDPAAFAPGGLPHLILEVVAYAADEADARGGGHCTVTFHADGSVSVADDGRGTDTRFDDRGRAVKKPVMASKDLRFFDQPDAPLLPDGRPRRGMSVVAALSGQLVHVNRRAEGSWVQHYLHGVPATDLTPIEDDGTTGTTVRFSPDPDLCTAGDVPPDAMAGLLTGWPQLSVRVDDRRTG
ncbi:ATP-binding protein [Streptomyces sp. NPDC059176]|uniref:ATP-binding protein n=1 Tax=unclassified Streptomyces TaxID=2593676 RepID=UPI0036835203